MAELKIAFWNLQNLFDTTLSDIAADFDYTPENGWDTDALEHKLDNLAEVIDLMHEGGGPDLLGICEVENESLVRQLASRLERAGEYDVAHVDSPDIRGIDTSLVYSTEVFALAVDENGDDIPPRAHLIHARYPTRDIFEVRLRVLASGEELMVLVNHWPSRSGGRAQTEPYRITVAGHCGKLIDDYLKLDRLEYLPMPDTEQTLDALNERWNRNVLVMGDLNDEPFDHSVMEELQASSGEDHLEERLKRSPGRDETPAVSVYLGKQAYLFNCMWPFLGMPDTGTHHFSGSVNTMNLLDHFIVSRGLYFGDRGLKMSRESVEIFAPGVMATSGKGRPRAFDRKSGKGYSDHFPIQARIEIL